MSEAAAPPRHPDCSCSPSVPEGAYSMDCAHHLAEHTPPPSGLDLAAVQELLARRRYRPGWTLRAYVGDTMRQVMLEISATVEDSYNPGSNAPLDIRWPIPAPALESELAFDKWAAWRLGQIELHESAEWYQRPGRDLPWVPVFNPHLDGADRDRWPIVRRHPAT